MTNEEAGQCPHTQASKQSNASALVETNKPSSKAWISKNWLFGRKKENIPASIEESLQHPSKERIDANQKHYLGTNRSISSIPRGGNSNENEASVSNCMRQNKPPAHQPPDSQKWVYPSEQQFYNAMIRKGHKPSSKDVPTILAIHNAVNERTWQELLHCEELIQRSKNIPKLVRFLGRPKDLSPKAFFNTYVKLYNPPFDRHDWFIDRGDGHGERRYVIDFYRGSIDNGMYLDVRPAIDDWVGVRDRLSLFSRFYFPGIFAPSDNVNSKPQTHFDSR